MIVKEVDRRGGGECFHHLLGSVTEKHLEIRIQAQLNLPLVHSSASVMNSRNPSQMLISDTKL